MWFFSKYCIDFDFKIRQKILTNYKAIKFEKKKRFMIYDFKMIFRLVLWMYLTFSRVRILYFYLPWTSSIFWNNKQNRETCQYPKRLKSMKTSTKLRKFIFSHIHQQGHQASKILQGSIYWNFFLTSPLYIQDQQICYIYFS